jgi:hypothetical protein
MTRRKVAGETIEETIDAELSCLGRDPAVYLVRLDVADPEGK